MGGVWTDRSDVPLKGSYWLVGLEGRARKVRLPIDSPILIGRGTYNHVVLDDPRLSRQHSRLVVERDGCYVYDLGSANGTQVNSVKVTEKGKVLSDGDVITFGKTMMQFRTL